MRNAQNLAAVLISCVFFCPSMLPAEAVDQDQARPGPQAGWSSFARGFAVYQFDTDLDEGGSYDITRFNIQAGQSYGWDARTSVSLALSYSYDDYAFSGGGRTGLAALDPWSTINSISISAPMRRGLGDHWSAFLIPSVQSSGESGADFNDTITGGAFAGFSYRFSDRLTLGPGIGVTTELEDSATVFPILLVNWKITDRLSFETGQGLGATQGPGLILNYQVNDQWRAGIGGRYEKLRFRLDEDGRIPGGIGEDNSYALFATCDYDFSSKIAVSLVGGTHFGGELRLEDENGDRIIKESYDPGMYMGLTFMARF